MSDLSPQCAPKRTSANAYRGHALVVVQQHPADGCEPDDDGSRDRPCADADVADGLPVGFIPGDLAIALLGFPIRVAHCLPSLKPTSKLPST
jgi:hypothetical protein